MQTIVGRFADGSRVKGAIEALLVRNFDASDIRYVAIDEAAVAAGVAGEVSTTDAAGGGAAGVLGVLGGFAALAIPYVGPVLAAAPLAVGLAGAGAGAAQQDVDHLRASLAEIGVPDAAARGYREAVDGGGALVLVRAREVVGDDIESILRASGAVAVDRHARAEK